MPIDVKFFTRKKCPLCVKAKDILTELQNKWGFTLQEINIEESDELTERYGLMIPVVVINEKEIQYGQIDRFTIEDALEQGKMKNLQ